MILTVLSDPYPPLSGGFFTYALYKVTPMYTLNLRANDNGDHPDLNWSEYPIGQDAICVDNPKDRWCRPETFKTLVLRVNCYSEGPGEYEVTEVSTGTTVRVLY